MIDKNDPRLTAFVLGELDEQERATIEKAISESSELAQAVDEIRQTTTWLSSEFASEEPLGLGADRKEELVSAKSVNATEPKQRVSKTPGSWKGSLRAPQLGMGSCGSEFAGPRGTGNVVAELVNAKRDGTDLRR